MTAEFENIDVELGELVRHYRLSSGMSQMDLGEAAGISYQQIQKYESGANKVSVSRLYALATALGASPSELLSELERRRGKAAVDRTGSVETMQFMATRRGQQILRALSQCRDDRLLDAFIDLFLAATAAERRTNGATERHAGLTP